MIVGSTVEAFDVHAYKMALVKLLDVVEESEIDVVVQGASIYLYTTISLKKPVSVARKAEIVLREQTPASLSTLLNVNVEHFSEPSLTSEILIPPSYPPGAPMPSMPAEWLAFEQASTWLASIVLILVPLVMCLYFFCLYRRASARPRRTGGGSWARELYKFVMSFNEASPPSTPRQQSSTPAHCNSSPQPPPPPPQCGPAGTPGYFIYYPQPQTQQDLLHTKHPTSYSPELKLAHSPIYSPTSYSPELKLTHSPMNSTPPPPPWQPQTHLPPQTIQPHHQALPHQRPPWRGSSTSASCPSSPPLQWQSPQSQPDQPSHPRPRLSHRHSSHKSRPSPHSRGTAPRITFSGADSQVPSSSSSGGGEAASSSPEHRMRTDQMRWRHELNLQHARQMQSIHRRLREMERGDYEYWNRQEAQSEMGTKSRPPPRRRPRDEPRLHASDVHQFL